LHPTTTETPPQRPRRWLVAVVVIVAAFGLGYGGRKLLADDSGGSDSPAIRGITFAGGKSFPLGTPESVILTRLSGLPHVWKRQGGGVSCAYYLLTDQPGTSWGFCFRRAKLHTSGTLAP
jgi:hypothetical protein